MVRNSCNAYGKKRKRGRKIKGERVGERAKERNGICLKRETEINIDKINIFYLWSLR